MYMFNLTFLFSCMFHVSNFKSEIKNKNKIIEMLELHISNKYCQVFGQRLASCGSHRVPCCGAGLGGKGPKPVRAPTDDDYI